MIIKLLLALALALALTGCYTTIHSQTIQYPNKTRVTRTSIYIAGGFAPYTGSIPAYPEAQRQLTLAGVSYE